MKRVPDHRSDVLKGLLPQGPPRIRNTEYPSIRRLGEESETESRDEATRRGTVELYERLCGSRLELFCIETGCWLVASGEGRVKEWCGQVLELIIRPVPCPWKRHKFEWLFCLSCRDWRASWVAERSGRGAVSTQYHVHQGDTSLSDCLFVCLAGIGGLHELLRAVGVVQWAPSTMSIKETQNFEKGRIKALQDERVYIQKKTFTKWANAFLEKVSDCLGINI